MPKISLKELKKDQEIRARILGNELTFATTWGLFSPEEIDEGTRLLCDALSLPTLNQNSNATNPVETDAANPTNGAKNQYKKILDIGCGYGPIGIALAKQIPEATVEMIDKDFVAVEYSNINAIKNGVQDRVKSYLSNGFSHVPTDASYDLIISNLPAKVSKEFFWILFGEAFEHMDIESDFVVVAIRQLEPMLIKSFAAVFGNSTILAQSKTYTVVSAKKTSDIQSGRPVIEDQEE